MQCHTQDSIEEMISDIVRQPIHNSISDNTTTKEDIVGKHGRGTSHEYVGECRTGVGGECGSYKGMEPMHGVGLVRTIPYRHGTLDGHEDAHCFGGIGEIHGDEMEEWIHGDDDDDDW